MFLQAKITFFVIPGSIGDPAGRAVASGISRRVGVANLMLIYNNAYNRKKEP